MGAQGHGVAHIGGEKHFIPFTLPGERVRIELHGQRPAVAEIETASPDRIAPICKHFGTCGGCALQHWAEAPYKDWKAGSRNLRAGAGRDRSSPSRRSGAIRYRAAAAPPSPPTAVAVKSCLATMRRAPTRPSIWRNARSSCRRSRKPCRICGPRSAPPCRRKSEAKISVTAAANGLDCAIQGPTLRASANAQGHRRLSVRPVSFARFGTRNPCCSRLHRLFRSAVSRVTLPPDAFLQAVEACERDMADWVIGCAFGRKGPPAPFCDLFAGLGAFTFPAARLAPVTAYEENQSAVAALAAAAKRAKGLKAVSAIRRDLYRNPLGPLELNKFARRHYRSAPRRG